MNSPTQHNAAGTSLGTFSTELASAQPSESGNPNEQWVHMLPAGTFQARDGRGPWTVKNAEEVIEATRAYAGKNQLAVDYEHQIDLAEKNGKPAPAAGWIKGLQSRKDGIWGLVEWTERAKEHLSAKEYRYLSPVFHHAPGGAVIRFLRAALTNNPALELTALASATDASPDELSVLRALAAESRTLLGLDPEADPETILSKLRELMTARNSASADPAGFVPIGVVNELQWEIESLRADRDRQEREALIEANIAKLPGVAMIAWARTQTLDQLKTFLASAIPLAALEGSQTSRLSSEHKAMLMGIDRRGFSGAEQEEICNALGHTHEDFQKYGPR